MRRMALNHLHRAGGAIFCADFFAQRGGAGAQRGIAVGGGVNGLRQSFGSVEMRIFITWRRSISRQFF